MQVISLQIPHQQRIVNKRVHYTPTGYSIIILITYIAHVYIASRVPVQLLGACDMCVVYEKCAVYWQHASAAQLLIWILSRHDIPVIAMAGKHLLKCHPIIKLRKEFWNDIYRLFFFDALLKATGKKTNLEHSRLRNLDKKCCIVLL